MLEEGNRVAFMDYKPHELGVLIQPTVRCLPVYSVSALLVSCVCALLGPPPGRSLGWNPPLHLCSTELNVHGDVRGS